MTLLSDRAFGIMHFFLFFFSSRLCAIFWRMLPQKSRIMRELCELHNIKYLVAVGCMFNMENIIHVFALFHFRSQESKNSSSVVMQEDSTRTQYKPQVWIFNIIYYLDNILVEF